MCATRTWRVVQLVWTRLYRDPRAVWAIFLVPIGTLLLIGFVMRNTEEDLTVALVVAGQQWSTLDTASYVEESLDADGVATFRAPSREAAEKAIRDGRADAFVVIDDAFARGVLGGEQQTLAVGVEGDDPGRNERVLATMGRALTTAPLKVFRNSTGAEPLPPEGPIEFDTTYVYGGEDYGSLDYVLPALLAFLAFLSPFVSTVVGTAVERVLHTFERLGATAMRGSEYMLGSMLAWSVVVAAEAGALLLAAILLLGVHYEGNLGVIFLLTVITGLGAVNLGILLSFVVQTEAQASQIIPLVLVPQGILGGVLFPLDSLPNALEAIARFLPITYSVSALRDVMIRDHGLFDAGVAGNLAVMLAFAAFFLVLSARSLKRAVV